MVTCSELEADKRLATSMLKYMTGGEAVTARFLFEGEFEFMPTFKPWLASNVKPPLSDSSKGLWRRLVLIPFTVQIERPDRMLKIKLVERELPGILSWAVLGCRMWQEEGLEEPTEIREATLEYQADTDIVGTFLDECCILEGEVLSGALYSSYSSWCSRRGLHVPSNMLLTAKIKDKGFTMIRKTKGKTWQGLSLSAPMFQDAEDDVFGAPVEVS